MAQQTPQGFSPFQQPTPLPPPPRKHMGAATAAAALVLILAIAVILNESVLKIHSIAVVGNQRVSWEQVVKAAGLDSTVSFFSVNESRIEKGIEANRYLIFERLEKQFPDKLTLYVRERQPQVFVSEMGAIYALDTEGMVLERNDESLNTKEFEDLAKDAGCVIVTGLKPKELRVGRMMTAGTGAHMEAYHQLLTEITLQGYFQQVSELNVTDPESIYLITRNGYTAHLGDLTDLRAKIGTVRAVEAKLIEMGKTGGMMEVTIPGEAIYTPESP